MPRVLVGGKGAGQKAPSCAPFGGEHRRHAWKRRAVRIPGIVIDVTVALVHALDECVPEAALQDQDLVEGVVDEEEGDGKESDEGAVLQDSGRNSTR